MKRRNRSATLKNRQGIFAVCLLVAMMLMGVAYAAITSVSMDIVGTLSVEAGEGAYISNAVFASGQNVVSAEVLGYNECVLHTDIDFASLDADSDAIFDVTLTNNSDKALIFAGTNFDELFYVDGEGNYNSDIVFELIGLQGGDILEPNSDLTFNIKFKYGAETVSQNELNSYVNFAFMEGYTIRYLHIDNTTNYPHYIGAGQTLAVNLSGSTNVDTVKVYVDNIETTNFTYENNLLTVPNVSGNLIIEHPIVLAEDALPSEPVQPEPGTGAQISSGFTSEYLSSETGISESSMSRFNSVTESYDPSTSTYYLTVKKSYKILQSINPDTENFNLEFNIKNDSALIWTNGNVTEEHTSTNNTLSDVSGTLSKTTLSPGETAVLNMQFTLVIYGAFWGNSYNEQIIYSINYDIDGTVKTMRLVLSFES